MGLVKCLHGFHTFITILFIDNLLVGPFTGVESASSNRLEELHFALLITGLEINVRLGCEHIQPVVVVDHVPLLEARDDEVLVPSVLVGLHEGLGDKPVSPLLPRLVEDVMMRIGFQSEFIGNARHNLILGHFLGFLRRGDLFLDQNNFLLEVWVLLCVVDPVQAGVFEDFLTDAQLSVDVGVQNDHDVVEPLAQLNVTLHSRHGVSFL